MSFFSKLKDKVNQVTKAAEKYVNNEETKGAEVPEQIPEQKVKSQKEPERVPPSHSTQPKNIQKQEVAQRVEVMDPLSQM